MIDLVQGNTVVSIPFLYSSRGYGLLWNSPAMGRAELGADLTRWVAEESSFIDYWITAGDGAGARALPRFRRRGLLAFNPVEDRQQGTVTIQGRYRGLVR